MIETIRTALRGNEVDLTKLDIRRGLILLSIPMILEMMMEGVFAIVDVYFVGKLGNAAVSAIGLTEALIMIIYSVALGLATAASAFVARRIGEGNHERAAHVIMQSVILTVLVSLIVAVPCVLWAEELLTLMGATNDILQVGTGYFRIMFASNIVILFLFLFNGVFRSSGNPAYAMRVLWIANGINIVLDPLLIFGLGPIPAFGLEGAAWATVVGRSAGVFIQLHYLLKKQEVIPVHAIRYKRDLALIKSLAVKSAEATGQYLIETISWVFLMRVAAIFGKSALAAYTIVFRVIGFSILPIWGMAMAAATMVGQYLGMERVDSARKSVILASIYNFVYLLIISILYFLSAHHLISLFTTDMEVIRIGASGIKILCVGYLAFGIGMVMQQAFNGAGDTLTPAWLSAICYILIQIPLAYLLAVHWNMQLDGVYWSITIAHGVLALLFIWLFKRDVWVKAKI
jgi:putative MATE family efflux protein